jgi:acetyl/propionyl-CoA carboxylase alpha subunit
VEADGHHWWVQVGGASHRLAWRSPLPEPEQRRGWSGSLVAPMPGQIVAVLVAEGQAVHAGQPLVTLEAMKMEHTIRAPHDGVVAAVHFRAGEQVAATAVLLDVRPATPGESADV